MGSWKAAQLSSMVMSELGSEDFRCLAGTSVGFFVACGDFLGLPRGGRFIIAVVLLLLLLLLLVLFVLVWLLLVWLLMV